MSNLAEREQEIIEQFDWIDDKTDRYIQIIDYGKQLSPMDESLKVDSNLVKGCQSKVWLSHSLQGNTLTFFADSNTAITKGIVAILLELWNGLPPSEIVNASTDVLEKIQLKEHLTSQRSNGLSAMIDSIKKIASQYE